MQRIEALEEDEMSTNSSSTSIGLRGLWGALRRRCSAGRNRAPSAPSFLSPPALPPRKGLTGSRSAETHVPHPVAPTLAKPVNCKEVIDIAERVAGKADVRAEGLKAQMRDTAEVELWRHRAEVFRKAYADCAVDSDVDAEARKLSELSELLLDPTVSLQENEVLCCKRAEKIERTNDRCGPLAEEALAEAARWRSAILFLSETQGAEDEAVGELAFQLHRDLCAAGHIKEPRLKKEISMAASIRRKYGKEVDCFLSPSGHEVVVGRSAGANERVSFELALANGFWFHADSGVAGSHVAILCPASEVHALEDVEFAAAICAWHSKARNESNASVCYCHAGQLARPLIPKLGQVMITGRRGQLHVTPSLPTS